jgi:hypothetical protein
MALIFLFPLLQMMIHSTHAEVTLQIPSLNSTRESLAPSLPLTAENFLDPLTDQNRGRRPSTWPAKLTFSAPLDLTAEEVRTQLQGERRLIFHCGGRPVESSVLASHRFLDGYIYQSANFEFRNNQWLRKLFSPGQRYLARPHVDRTCRVNILRHNNSATEFDLLYAECNRDVAADRGSMVRINETGETAFEYYYPAITFRCPNGDPIKSLLVPSNTQLISSI